MSTTFVNIQTPESGVIKDGLVYWFVPSNSNTYPGTGTKAYDLSGTNGDSDIINTPTYNGKTFVLSNGSNQNIELPNLSLNYPLNISFIAKEPVSGTNGPGIVFSNPTVANKSIAATVQKSAAGGIRAFKFDGTFQATTKTTDMEYDRFYYVSANFTSSSIDLYVDGEYDSSLAGPHAKIWTDTDTSYNIGKLNRPAPVLYPGEYGDMQIYNRALSADEIRQNMRALKSKYGMLGLTIHDAFTGSGSLAGRTPDTVSNGSVWEVPESDTSFTVVSGGAVRSTYGGASPDPYLDNARIDIGTTGKFRIEVEVDWNSSTSNGVGINIWNTDGSGTNDETHIHHKMGFTSREHRIGEYISGSGSVLVEDNGKFSANGTYYLTLDYDGTTLTGKLFNSSRTLLSTISTSSFTITPSAKCGIHFGSISSMTSSIKDFKVYA